jgi:hypothetical protein
LAIRSGVTDKKITFKHNGFSFTGMSAKFVPYNSACDTSGLVQMTSFGGLAFSMTYNFNNLNVKGCTANTGQRRTNDFSSNEEQFFWRLCAVKTEGFQTFTYDFRNLMVTATDIQIVAEYRNPVVTGTLDVTVKFVESCGFLWSERDWKVTSYFRFMRADIDCSYFVGSTTTEGTYEANNWYGSVNYVMYEASLIKYFMDDSDYTSTVHFNANPISASTPNVYRMCLYAQGGHVSTLDTNKWIDYPHVALFPVSEHVKLSARSNLWQTSPVETNCPKGWLGCACNTSNFCEANFHRALDSGVGSVQASCNTGTGSDSFCEAPTRVLFGSHAAYSSSPRIVCSVPTPCSNPGPAISGSGLAMRFSSNDLVGGTDIIRFVQSTADCEAGSVPPAGSYTNVLKNVVTGNLVQNWGGNLNAFFYRLCVGDSNGLYAKDYFSTGFAVTNQGSSAPTRRTLRPTTRLNKGHTITMAPTKTNPVFGGSGRFPENPEKYNTLVPSNQDFLYITQENTDSNPLYTQLTNFTYQDLVAQDSLRVYRTLPLDGHYADSKQKKNLHTLVGCPAAISSQQPSDGIGNPPSRHCFCNISRRECPVPTSRQGLLHGVFLSQDCFEPLPDEICGIDLFFRCQNGQYRWIWFCTVFLSNHPPAGVRNRLQPVQHHTTAWAVHYSQPFLSVERYSELRQLSQFSERIHH